MAHLCPNALVSEATKKALRDSHFKLHTAAVSLPFSQIPYRVSIFRGQ